SSCPPARERGGQGHGRGCRGQNNQRTKEKRMPPTPSKERRARRSASSRASALKKYGMTVEDYDAIFARQRGICSICLKRFDPSTASATATITIVAGCPLSPASSAMSVLAATTTIRPRCGAAPPILSVGCKSRGRSFRGAGACRRVRRKAAQGDLAAAREVLD